MENIVACCGCICNECPYYQKECGGCPKIQGKPFWLEYTGEERCSIYRCCVEEKKLPTGRCSELPCSRYDQQDRQDAGGKRGRLKKDAGSTPVPG